MFRRGIISSVTAAVVDTLGFSSKAQAQGSSREDCRDGKYLVHCEPSSPTHSDEGLITTMPADAAAAADGLVSPKSAAAAVRAAAATGTEHSGLEGAHPSLAAELAGASFEELCNDGSAWSWANWKVKVYRWTLLWIKQVYLIWLAMSVPTNHIMVSREAACTDPRLQCDSLNCAMSPCIANSPLVLMGGMRDCTLVHQCGTATQKLYSCTGNGVWHAACTLQQSSKRSVALVVIAAAS